MFTPEMYRERRRILVEKTQGPVLLMAAFEDKRVKFYQDSTFYYYTGINEPGAVCYIDKNGVSTLFLPNYNTNRAQWVPQALSVSQETAQKYGFDTVEFLGDPCKGYVIDAYLDPLLWKHCIDFLKARISNISTLFVIPKNYSVDALCKLIPEMADKLQDCSPFIANMRRTKSKEEIQALYNAVDVTMIAQEAAARAIAEGKNECQVAAAVDYIFAEAGAVHAFPTIIGSGTNATVLHYNDNCKFMQAGECVIVDVGASLGHYCGDLTRTYPVSGKFSARQKEIYQAVLDTQQHLAALAQPGMWLRNDDNKEKSLYHQMHSFLQQRGLEKYIAHGVGHFLGLDVHDVGDTKDPLREGDVITIEPGIYIPEESFGVRIEDDYWIVEGGSVCLSEALPSQVEAIEELVQQNF